VFLLKHGTGSLEPLRNNLQLSGREYCGETQIYQAGKYFDVMIRTAEGLKHCWLTRFDPNASTRRDLTQAVVDPLAARIHT
jgi:hypothetical protein